MSSNLEQDMKELRRQLKKGSVPRAYRTLLSYIMALRTHFAKTHGEAAVSGAYQGYMDMTYFALFPPMLKRLGLKVAIVFNYNAFRFEAWLSGRNRKVQSQYWRHLKDVPWDNYRVVPPAEGIDSILECDLATDFDLARPEQLTSKIEKGTRAFVAAIESYLSRHRCT